MDSLAVLSGLRGFRKRKKKREGGKIKLEKNSGISVWELGRHWKKEWRIGNGHVFDNLLS